MMTEIPSDVESCTDLNLEDGVPEFALGMELHDPQEVDQSLCFDVHQCAAYEVSLECRDCSMSWQDFEIVGSKPSTVADFNRVVYDLYESFYEDSRSVSHHFLQLIAPAEEPGAREWFAGFFGEAVDLGWEDAVNGQDKRSEQEVLEYVLPDRLRFL